ncbi:chaperone modulator CbpM [Flavimarina sp. Hel_I_48]|uniref:chaperone modulator CbpM n=1 Tax=Flavimarina sp. Hel_I_48 TaxID=1392488 RepID=UPI000690480D|nr:chaperone modulator CbpM [Flavimarina sp. Hel_I_48]
MKTEALILAETFCSSHEIEFTYIYTLRDHGFIDLIEEQETVFIKPEELPKLEQIMRFNRDLHINLEGIDVIMNLLNKIQGLQEEKRTLKNRVNINPLPTSNPHPASPKGRSL